MGQDPITSLWKQADCPGCLGYTEEYRGVAGILHFSSGHSWETTPVSCSSWLNNKSPAAAEMYRRAQKHQLAALVVDRAWKLAHMHFNSNALSDLTTPHRNNLLHLKILYKVSHQMVTLTNRFLFPFYFFVCLFVLCVWKGIYLFPYLFFFAPPPTPPFLLHLSGRTFSLNSIINSIKYCKAKYIKKIVNLIPKPRIWFQCIHLYSITRLNMLPWISGYIFWKINFKMYYLP